MSKALMFGVVGSIALASSAQAAQTHFGELNLKLSGYGTLVGAVVDQSNQAGLDNAVGAIVGSAWIDSDAEEYGAVVALDIDYASNFNSSLNDAGSSTILNQAWIYMDSPYGRLEVGQEDGAARVLGVHPPSVSGSVRVDNPEVFLLGYPCKSFCGSDPQQPGSIFSPNGMQLRSDIHSSDVWLKIAYFTPRVSGFQLGVSYTPDGSRRLGDFFGGGQDQHNKQSNVFDVAVNYIATVGAVDVGASAGYVTGQSEINDSPGFFGNVWDWGGAVNLGYREWTAGAAYRRTNVAGGGPVEEGLFLSNVYDGNDTEIWSAGLTYATGPWAFGVDYITSREQLPFSRDQNGKGMEGSIGYTFDEHIRLVGGYQHFQFDGPFGVCLTDAGGGGCDSLDANVGFVETKFSF